MATMATMATGEGPQARFVLPIAEGLELALLTLGDAPRLVRLVRDNLARLEPWLPFATAAYDETAATDYIRRSARDWASGRGLGLGIWADGELAGAIGIHNLSWDQGHAELGYWLAAAFEGRGLVTRSAERLLDWMFAEAGLERAEIRAAVDNARSRAVAERLGFVEEGVSRHASWVAGRWLDMAIYGQVRAEWQMRRRMNAGQ